MDGGDWLGPDLPATFAQLAHEGYRGIVVAPVGLVADPVETLYGLDVVTRAQALAARIGSFARARASTHDRGSSKGCERGGERPQRLGERPINPPRHGRASREAAPKSRGHARPRRGE
jgi:hypothetical protein